MGLYASFGGSNMVNEAIRFFGIDSVDVIILCEIKCSDSVDLDLCLSLLWIKYIRDLGTIVPNGYNVSLGGEELGIPIGYLPTDTDYVKAYSSCNKDILDLFISKDNNKHPLCVNGKYTNIKHKFRVGQYRLNGDLVNTFASIRDAAHETGIAYSQIYNCLKGNTTKAAGYKWKKIDE